MPDEDDTSSIVGVLLDPRTIDMIKRAKTKALSIIKLSVKDQIVPYILNIKNPKACWDVLKRRFEISNNARRLVVCHKFSNLHMEEGSSIADFMCTIQDIVNQLSQFGGLVDESIIVNQLSQFGELHDESIIVEQIVNALPSSFDSLSRIISSKRDIPTLEEIAMHLELQERKNANHNCHHDEKLLSSSFGRCFNKDMKDHMEDSTAKLAITMLEALKDLGILLSSLVIVVVVGNMVIGQKSVQTLERGRLPAL